MLAGSHYSLEKTENIVGAFPYSFDGGVCDTLSWMYGQKLVKFQPIEPRTTS